MLKSSRPNSISLLRNVVWIGRSVSQLLPIEQQPCKVLVMDLYEISKSFPLTVFQLTVWFIEKLMEEKNQRSGLEIVVDAVI